jgi:cytosine/adenosine deaminase-related metal-dependent hydrolase
MFVSKSSGDEPAIDKSFRSTVKKSAGAPGDLLTNIVFSLARTAVRDVVVAGKRIVEDGKHQADTF